MGLGAATLLETRANYRPNRSGRPEWWGRQALPYNADTYFATHKAPDQLSAAPSSATAPFATASPAPALALVADDMRVVDGVIRQQLGSEVLLVGQVAEYIIGAGGKRVRPALLLLMCQALGCTDARRAAQAQAQRAMAAAQTLPPSPSREALVQWAAALLERRS